jgi:hypothetical protein
MGAEAGPCRLGQVLLLACLPLFNHYAAYILLLTAMFMELITHME